MRKAMGIERYITIKHRNARSVRPFLSWRILTQLGRLSSPSLLTILVSFPTPSDTRGAERHAIRVIGVVVVRVAVVVHIAEVRAVGSKRGTEPPVLRT